MRLYNVDREGYRYVESKERSVGAPELTQETIEKTDRDQLHKGSEYIYSYRGK